MKEVKRTKIHVLKVYNNYSKLPNILEPKYSHIDSKKDYKSLKIEKILPEECLMTESHKNCIETWSNFAYDIICKELRFLINTIENKNVKKIHSNNKIWDIYFNIQEVIENLLSNGFDPNLILIPHEIFVKLRSHHLIQKEYLKDFHTVNIIHLSECQNPDEIIVIDTNSMLSSYKLDKKTNERLWINITKVQEKLDVNMIIKINIEIIDPDGIEIIKINDKI